MRKIDESEVQRLLGVPFSRLVLMLYRQGESLREIQAHIIGKGIPCTITPIYRIVRLHGLNRSRAQAFEAYSRAGKGKPYSKRAS